MALRTGILGCGSFANKHAEILSGLRDEVDLVAFCDVDETRARTFAQSYAADADKVALFTDHTAMFDQAGLDFAVICLPPFAHSDEVMQAADRGIHLLVEKPIALSSDHAWQMVEAAESAGIVAHVGFMFRYGAAIERLKAQLDSGAIGPAGLMSARYFCNSLHTSWWPDKTKSGGQLVEQVIHMFDLMRYLLGDPVSVYSRQENRFHQETPGYTIEDVSATVVSFSGGALGVVYATNGAIPDKWINDYRVVTQRLTAEFADANHARFYDTSAPDTAPVEIASDEDVYALQMRELLNAIKTGGTTRTPIREGAKSLDLVLAAAKSAETHAEELI